MQATPSLDLYTIGNMDVPELPEVDPNFEPQQRARSNTWPLRPQEFVEKEPENKTTAPPAEESPENVRQDPLGLNKKTSSRRNAWGNLSYADLITKAIQSSPEQRLTLSQIYDWMVQNVPYFKDKGDSNSSAGWKNSIRHNLSLHSRFVRVQNEGTGKSSWWVINPEAKPGKSPRRRATSMDTKTYEKKRGRVKKKVEALRAGNSPNGSDFGEGNELLEDPSLHYNLSPQDFRQRTSSNASSIGRLSPIPAVEPDLHDNQVPPMSPIPWGDIPSSYSSTQDQYTDSVQNSLANMMVGDQSLSPLGQDINDDLLLQQQQTNGIGFQTNTNLMSPPPPYPEGGNLRRSPQTLMANNLGGLTLNNSLASLVNQNSNLTNGMGTAISSGSATFMTQALDVLQSDSMYAQEAVMNQDPLITLAGNELNQFGGLNSNSAFQSQSLRALSQQSQQQASIPRPRFINANQQQGTRQQTDSLLRQALTQQKQHPNSSLFQLVSSQNQSSTLGTFSTTSPQGFNNQNLQQQMGLQQVPSMLPSDFTEIALNELKDGGIECDMEQIINQELSIDGNLDFNFDNIASAGNLMQSNVCNDVPAFGQMKLGQT